MARVADRFQVIHRGITFQFQTAEEGGYVVSVPSAPGCWSQGDSFEEALAMIQDALKGWLYVAKKESLSIAEDIEASRQHHQGEIDSSAQ